MRFTAWPIILPRRRFLVGAASLLAAPAIVRFSSLMPVKAWETLTARVYKIDYAPNHWINNPLLKEINDASAPRPHRSDVGAL
jgi:hypothetical protein